MKERAAPSGRLRSFGPVTSQGTVAKYLSEDEGNRVIETFGPITTKGDRY
jgi:hypothetical protein